MLGQFHNLVLISILFSSAVSYLESDNDCGFDCFPKIWEEIYESTQKVKREVLEEFNITVEDLVNKVQFFLYTRKNPTRYQLLNDSESIANSHFNPEKVTKIIIHGWLNSHISPFPKMATKAYLTRYDANVIVVDWEEISHWVYPNARAAVPQLAEILAAFLGRLVAAGAAEAVPREAAAAASARLHLVGHSLGAHLAGIAGLRFNYTIGRITGLDPASPLFTLSEEDRLSNTSAAFVDVIHTCGLLLGFFSPLGQADFYPNRGVPIQPGCGADFEGQCSHGRAYRYFIESILTPGGFMGVSCPNWKLYKDGECVPGFAEMGENVPRSARGIFYLETFNEAPFSRGRMDFP